MPKAVTAAPCSRVLRLARPLGGLTELRSYDPFISDLAALLAGVKPVIYIDDAAASRGYIAGLCRALKLVHLFPEEEHPGAGNYHLRGRRKFLLIGKSKKAMRAASAAWGASVLGQAWGEALGYPACCVKAYLAWKEAAERGGPDLIALAAAAGPRRKKLDFRLNNVYNYYSRVTRDPADRRQYRAMNALNPEVDLPGLHAVSWHPCSYACAASLKGAAAAFSFIEHYLPEHAAYLREHLARPVLFLDKYRFLNFAGRVSAGAILYNGICRPRSLATRAEVLKAVNSSVPAGKVLKLPVAKALAAYPGERPLLLPFSA